jgi:hypothetical protein
MQTRSALRAGDAIETQPFPGLQGLSKCAKRSDDEGSFDRAHRRCLRRRDRRLRSLERPEHLCWNRTRECFRGQIRQLHAVTRCAELPRPRGTGWIQRHPQAVARCPIGDAGMQQAGADRAVHRISAQRVATNSCAGSGGVHSAPRRAELSRSGISQYGRDALSRYTGLRSRVSRVQACRLRVRAKRRGRAAARWLRTSFEGHAEARCNPRPHWRR